ncbi:hypothetical protein TrST_g12761 [Triparma strigata]|uniref:Uncharacterized protein n=1 Tax=Triparma strigata TaxID=1606541 RepID=A0A9W7A1Y1_9STRA|nr:hypothetical protein TrST_g12761 [Triparma strigata]
MDSNPLPLLQGSSFWVYVGVTLTTLYTILNILAALTGSSNKIYGPLSSLALPVVLICYEETSEELVETVGVVGFLCATVCVISEVYSVSKAQSQKLSESANGNRAPESAPNEERPVSEIDGGHVVISILLTSSYTVLNMSYAVLMQDWTWIIAFMLMPLASTSMVMSFMMKPKRTDAKYKTFLLLHFLSFTVLSELGTIVGNFRTGHDTYVYSLVLKVPFWVVLWRELSKRRIYAAKLNPAELSSFLCNSVLVKGLSAMGPIVFFAFETVSCLISQGDLHSSKCQGTSSASMYLSMYLWVLFTLSISRSALPKSAQKATAVTYSDMASLKNLPPWQKFQGLLLSLACFFSLFLFSVLGVETERTDLSLIAGGGGAICMGAVVMIGLTRGAAPMRPGRNVEGGEEERKGDWGMSPIEKGRSDRAISASEIEEGMVLASMI